MEEVKKEVKTEVKKVRKSRKAAVAAAGGSAGGMDIHHPHPGTKVMHQALPVAGYKSESSETVARVNRNKVIEERMLRMIEEGIKDGTMDGRFAAMARSQFDIAWMLLNRAIFNPGRAVLPEDVKVLGG
jgi:hypothetical protein